MEIKEIFFTSCITVVALLLFIQPSTVNASIEFEPLETFPTGINPSIINHSDVDNDGDEDFVSSNHGGDTISILENNNGTFNLESFSSGGYNPHDMGLSDFDNDGDKDIVVLNMGEHPSIQRAQIGNIVVFSNDGDGNFIKHSTINLESATTNPRMLTVYDFDKDGYDDVAFTQTINGTVSILRNNKNLTFSIVQTLSVAVDPINIVSDDFDSDGDGDIVVTSWRGGRMTLFLNINGYFELFSSASILSANEIVSFDFDGDSDFDLVFEDAYGIQILFNNGNATFSNKQLIAPVFSTAITHADMNDDGFEDLIITGYDISGNYGVKVLCNNGSGSFTQTNILKMGNVLRSTTVGDFNFDRLNDIATVNYSTNEITIAFQRKTNTPPTLTLIGNQATTEGTPLQFTLSATDTDNDTLTYSATNLPQGATFDPKTHTFSWIPGYSDSGTYDVTFTVTDDGEPVASDTETITITVENSNRTPILTPIGNKTVNEGTQLQFVVSASDPDNDTLTYTAANLPQGATFNQNTQTFSWTPGYTDEGNYTDIEFAVMDNGTPMELAVELITITVGNVNRAPTLTNPGPQEVLETAPLALSISASDPDGDSITITASNPPSGATFDGATFAWIPSRTQAGIYTVTFTATDSGTPTESATLDMVITVGDNPTPVEQAEYLVDTVVAYNLPKNIENAYLANLQKVAEFITDGKVQAARNQLNAFIGKVQQDYQSGKLTVNQYTTLMNLANTLLGGL